MSGMTDDDFNGTIQSMIDEGRNPKNADKSPPQVLFTLPQTKNQKEAERKQQVFANARQYSPQNLIDLAIQNPEWSPLQYAEYFGKTESWFFSVVASDKFQKVLDPVRHMVDNSLITATLEERMRGLTIASVFKLQESLSGENVSPDIAIEAAKIGTKALGMGREKKDDGAEQKKLPTFGEIANKLHEMGSSGNLRQIRQQVTDVDATPVDDGII